MARPGAARELRQAIAAQPPGSVFTTRDILAAGFGGSRSTIHTIELSITGTWTRLDICAGSNPQVK